MYNYVNLIYFISGLIFYTIGILTFIAFFHNRIRCDFWLAWFYLAMGSTLPIYIFIPDTEIGVNILFWALIISSLLLPVIGFLLSLYIDEIVDGRFSLPTFFLGLTTGIIYGSFFSNPLPQIEWILTSFGSFPVLNVLQSQFIPYILTEMVLFTAYMRLVLRGWIAYRKSGKKIAFRQTWIYICLNVTGMGCYIVFNLLKRYNPIFLGGDLLAVGVIYGILAIYRLKRPALFHFLPFSMDRIVILLKSGMTLLDYDCQTHTFSEDSQNLKEQLMYGAIVTLNTLIHNDIMIDDRFLLESNNHTNILWYTGKHLICLCYSSKDLSNYCNSVRFLIRHIEHKFLRKIPRYYSGFSPDAQFKQAIKSEFDRII